MSLNLSDVKSKIKCLIANRENSCDNLWLVKNSIYDILTKNNIYPFKVNSSDNINTKSECYQLLLDYNNFAEGSITPLSVLVAIIMFYKGYCGPKIYAQFSENEVLIHVRIQYCNTYTCFNLTDPNDGILFYKNTDGILLPQGKLADANITTSEAFIFDSNVLSDYIMFNNTVYKNILSFLYLMSKYCIIKCNSRLFPENLISNYSNDDRSVHTPRMTDEKYFYALARVIEKTYQGYGQYFISYNYCKKMDFNPDLPPTPSLSSNENNNEAKSSTDLMNDIKSLNH